jgi:exosortase/archaeosortase family protein
MAYTMQDSCVEKRESLVKHKSHFDRTGLSFAFRFCLYSSIGLGWLYFGEVDFLLQPMLILLARIVGEILSLTGLAVIVLGQKVVYPGIFGIDIANECSAVSQMIIVASALFAYSTGLRLRLLGLLLFAAIIFVGNILRLVSLFWMGIWAEEHFDFVHFYVWGGLSYIGLLILLLIWMRFAYRPRLPN